MKGNNQQYMCSHNNFYLNVSISVLLIRYDTDLLEKRSVVTSLFDGFRNQ